MEDAIRNNKFRGTVIGPIAKYIKIIPGKERYAEIAELALGPGTLDRFIVTNSHDRDVMNKIRREAGCARDCDLFLVKEFPRFKIPPPPVAGIETVASVLSVSNDTVFNTLGK